MQVYIIEANPRASRTVPFVAKAIGHPLAKYASLLMSGQTLPELGFTEEPRLAHVAVKEAVLPFEKFPGPYLHPSALPDIFCTSIAYHGLELSGMHSRLPPGMTTRSCSGAALCQYSAGLMIHNPHLASLTLVCSATQSHATARTHPILCLAASGLLSFGRPHSRCPASVKLQLDTTAHHNPNYC